MTAPKYTRALVELNASVKSLCAGQEATNTNLTGLNTKVDTLIAHDYKHESRISNLEGSRLSRSEKFIGLGGGTGVVVLIAYAILQQIGWLPVG